MSEIKQLLDGKEVKESKDLKFDLIFEKELTNELSYNILHKGDDNGWGLGINLEMFARYFKGKYKNLERLRSRYIQPKFDEGFFLNEKVADKYKDIVEDWLVEFEEMFEKVKPFSYKETFELTNQTFQSLVWGSISIADMVENLNGKRIATAGIPVRHKQFTKEGVFTGYKEYDSIYEVYEADGHLLSSEHMTEDDKIYAVKCWCTSTNEEHFIWIEEQYKDDPLSAIASTFKVATNIIPYIKELKRQGDLLIVEYTQEGIDLGIKPEGDELTTLTKEQYFGWLTAQS